MEPADLPPLGYQKFESVGHVGTLVVPPIGVCCVKGQTLGVQLCPDCERFNNEIASASLGIGPEEKLKRVHEAWAELLKTGAIHLVRGVKFFCMTEDQMLTFGTVMEQTGYVHHEDGEED